MSTHPPDNYPAEPTPAPTPRQDDHAAAITQHVLRPAKIATLVTYASMFVITGGIHLSMRKVDTSFWITVLIGYAGAIFGWLAGFVASPYDSTEEKRLTRVTAFVSLITSGYLIGKLEPSITPIFNQLISEKLYGIRLLNFLINLICTGITVYLYRLYGVGSPYEKANLSGEAQSDSK